MMKKQLLTLFSLLALQISLLHAQDYCTKDISTNPFAPYNNEFSQTYGSLTNPWINSNFNIGALSGVGNAMQIPINTALSDWDQGVPSAMINPYSTSGTAHSRYSYLYPRDTNDVLIPFSLRDYHWEDGWELLYLGNGFYPNGESYGDENLDRLYDGESVPNNDKVPYIILYNRYRGVMRCFVNLIVPFGGYSDIKIELQFANTNNISGIFRHLEPIDRTLDMTTNVRLVESFMPNAGGNNRWLSADFHLGYDPCICNKMQQIRIRLYGVESFTLNLTGRGISFDQPIATVDANGNISPNYNTDWLSVHNAHNLEGGNQLFTSLDALIADYGTALANYDSLNIAFQDYTERQAILNAFKDITVKGVGGLIPGASGFTSWFIQPKPNQGDTTGSNLLNFLNGNAKGILGLGYDQLSSGINPTVTQPKAPDMPMASYSELRFTGDVVGESQFEAIGSFFVPGTYDESLALDDLEPWSYPAYNVAPGLAATMSIPTPLVKFESTTGEIITEPYTFPGEPYETQIQKEVYISSTKLNIRFETPPLIALNKSLDMNMQRTATYFMIEVEFSNSLPRLSPRRPKSKSTTSTFGNIFTELFYLADANATFDDDRRGLNRYASQWVPLESLNQTVFSIHRIDSIETERNAQFQPDGFFLNFVELNSPNFSHTQMKNDLKKVKIKIFHDFYFDQVGTNGLPVNTVQLFSYLLYDADSLINLLGEESDWSLPNPGVFDQYIPGVITLGNETITITHPHVHHVDGNEIFINAQSVLINGPLQVEPGYKLIIQALEQIHSVPLGSLNPNMHLRIKKDFYDTPVFEYADSDAVGAFCNDNRAYQANTASRALQERIERELAEEFHKEVFTPKAKNTSLSLYPNPARSELTIQSNGSGIDRLTIFDMATRPAMQANPGGQNMYRMDISNLAPGMYFVRADCGDEVLTEKLVVAK